MQFIHLDFSSASNAVIVSFRRNVERASKSREHVLMLSTSLKTVASMNRDVP
jgi:hypothetical protein